MAFALKGAGSATTANSTTANQSTLVVTTATTAGAAGDLAVLLYAVDNNQTTDGDEGAVTGVVDSAGNFWSKFSEFTNGQGTAQTGATCGVWWSNLQFALPIAGTVTLTFSNNTSRDASAASLTYFTKAAGFDAVIQGANQLANDAAAAGSLDVTTANVPCLRIRAIASESNSVTALTKTAAFTAVLTQSVAVIAAATSMGIRGEYLISTATGQASAPTNGAGAVDNASVYVAFSETFTALPPIGNNSESSGAQVLANARKTAAALLLSASSGLFLPPYPTVQVAPPVAPQGWHQALSVAPRPAKAVPTQPILGVPPPPVPALTAGVPVTTGNTAARARRVYYQARFDAPYAASAAAVTPAPQGWQAALSGAPKVAQAQVGFGFVPFNTAQIAAVAGIPLNMGDAAPSSRPVYYQSRFETPYLPPAVVAATPYGWQPPLSVAVRIGGPIHTQPSFVVPPFVVPQGWQQPLSTAPTAAKAQLGSSFVPFNTAQLAVNYTDFDWYAPLATAVPVAKPQLGYAPFVPYNTAQLAVNYSNFGWYAPLAGAPLVAKALQGFSSVPYDTAQIIFNTVTLDKWQVPLSVAPAVARARQGDAFVPYNTAQIVVSAYTNFWLQPLSTAVPVARATPDFGSVALFTPAIATLEWQPPLAKAVGVAQAQVGYSFVPFNTAQLAVNYTDFSWYQALSSAPTVAKARLADWSLPYTIVNAAGVAWQSPLAVAPSVTKAQPGFAAVPFYPAQPVAGIAGMAWFTPLWTVPTRNLTAPQGNAFVPFDTAQQIIVTTPGQRRPTLFIANVGRLMNH